LSNFRRPDPDHCANGHDLRVCGTFTAADSRRGCERERCRACKRKRDRAWAAKLRLRRKNATGGPLRADSGGAQSAGDG
jgi:hypothetical protein